MSELEKFLQQAAERLAQKLNEVQQPRQGQPPKQAGGAGQRPRGNQPASNLPPANSPPVAGRPQPRRPQSQRLSQTAMRTAERIPPQAEIIEAEILSNLTPRELGPNPLSSLDTRPALAQQISQADERMSGHVRDVFDHQVSQLRAPSGALGQGAVQGNIQAGVDLQRRQMDVSPLLKMLRQPQTLRAAFIASEIFKRKFE